MKCFEFCRHTRPINQLKINNDGDLLFTVGVDKIINMYNLNNYERYGSFQTQAACKCMEISEDSEQIIVGCMDGLLYVFQTNGGKQIMSIKTKSFQRIIYIEFSQGGKYLMILYEWNDKSQINIIEYDIVKRKIEQSQDSDKNIELNQQNSEEYSNFSECLSKVSWDATNERIYATTRLGFLIKFDRNFKEILRKKAHDGEATYFTFSQDFTIIASTGLDGGKIIDPETLEILREFKTDVPMNNIDISPKFCEQKKPLDQRFHFIMAGGIASRDAAQSKKGGFEIHLCDIEQGVEIGTINNHFSTVNCVLFLPHGEGFISAAEEGNAKMVLFNKSYFEND